MRRDAHLRRTGDGAERRGASRGTEDARAPPRDAVAALRDAVAARLTDDHFAALRVAFASAPREYAYMRRARTLDELRARTRVLDAR